MKWFLLYACAHYEYGGISHNSKDTVIFSRQTEDAALC